MIRSLSFNELLGEKVVTYRPDTPDSPGEGKAGVVVIMQYSDVSGGAPPGIPIEALSADEDMLAVARAGIARWARSTNGDFYAVMVEMGDVAARGHLVTQLANSIRLLST